MPEAAPVQNLESGPSSRAALWVVPRQLRHLPLLCQAHKQEGGLELEQAGTETVAIWNARDRGRGLTSHNTTLEPNNLCLQNKNIISYPKTTNDYSPFRS